MYTRARDHLKTFHRAEMTHRTRMNAGMLHLRELGAHLSHCQASRSPHQNHIRPSTDREEHGTLRPRSVGDVTTCRECIFISPSAVLAVYNSHSWGTAHSETLQRSLQILHGPCHVTLLSCGLSTYNSWFPHMGLKPLYGAGLEQVSR